MRRSGAQDLKSTSRYGKSGQIADSLKIATGTLRSRAMIRFRKRSLMRPRQKLQGKPSCTRSSSVKVSRA